MTDVNRRSFIGASLSVMAVVVSPLSIAPAGTVPQISTPLDEQPNECAPLDQKPITDRFGWPPHHPNCRCTVVNITTWGNVND